MVNTRSAGPFEGQASGSMFRADNPSGENGSRDFVPETPPEPPQGQPEPNPAGEDAHMEDVLSVHAETPPASVHEDEGPIEGPPPAAVLWGMKAQIDAEIARLCASKDLANARIELTRLRDQKSKGYPAGDDIGSESFKQRLTLERAKSVRDPDTYSGQSTRPLEDFIKQVDLVFETKPLTYRLELDKCVYTAAHLAGTPLQQWAEEKRRINEDPTRSFSYEDLKTLLRDRQLPPQVRFANLSKKIGGLAQRPNQSVPELIAFLNELEYQLDPPFEDRVRVMFLFNGLHPHIRRGIVEQNRAWSTRAELEASATSLETVMIPPDVVG